MCERVTETDLHRLIECHLRAQQALTVQVMAALQAGDVVQQAHLAHAFAGHGRQIAELLAGLELLRAPVVLVVDVQANVL